MWSRGWAVALKYSVRGIKTLRGCYGFRSSFSGHLALNHRPRSFADQKVIICVLCFNVCCVSVSCENLSFIVVFGYLLKLLCKPEPGTF